MVKSVSLGWTFIFSCCGNDTSNPHYCRLNYVWSRADFRLLARLNTMSNKVESFRRIWSPTWILRVYSDPPPCLPDLICYGEASINPLI